MPKRDPIASESDRHKKAFELYYAQGEKRSFPRLAKELGVSMAALKVWSKSFSWQKRIRERDAQAVRQMADQTLQSTVAESSRNKRIVQMALVRLAQAIASGQIKMMMGDLDRLVRLQAFLDGDGVVVTGETLRQRPIMEVCDAYDQWMDLLTDEELDALIKERKERKERDENKPAAPSPATDRPPTQGETNDQAPNPPG